MKIKLSFQFKLRMDISYAETYEESMGNDTVSSCYYCGTQEWTNGPQHYHVCNNCMGDALDNHNTCPWCLDILGDNCKCECNGTPTGRKHTKEELKFLINN